MRISTIPLVLSLACSSSSKPPSSGPGRVEPASTSGPIDVFVVVQEDQYETEFGDGYHAYFAAAFRTRAEAEAYAAEKGARKPTQNTGYRYHVRSGTLSRDAGGAWTMKAELQGHERIDANGSGVKTDFDALARSLGAR